MQPSGQAADALDKKSRPMGQQQEEWVHGGNIYFSDNSSTNESWSTPSISPQYARSIACSSMTARYRRVLRNEQQRAGSSRGAEAHRPRCWVSGMDE